eukprot:CAMPEP_0184719638 /NCGR_PEP_ID=MMETSP0314-20130426/9078_1 /TAXON_ID=38298 /ORGANISM="Rhodella maculata, Strain CCMP 736" /LENGTH=60 /DNA_ID=CAMNT_0027183555 /DNA_START=3 /DNA_END=181 /DNA_ORIENTATION=-
MGGLEGLLNSLGPEVSPANAAAIFPSPTFKAILLPPHHLPSAPSTGQGKDEGPEGHGQAA